MNEGNLLVTDNYFWLILLVIVICGVVGGIANVARVEHKEAITRRRWFSALSLGIVAAFVVPLFLNTISSNLLEPLVLMP